MNTVVFILSQSNEKFKISTHYPKYNLRSISGWLNIDSTFQPDSFKFSLLSTTLKNNSNNKHIKDKPIAFLICSDAQYLNTY